MATPGRVSRVGVCLAFVAASGFLVCCASKASPAAGESSVSDSWTAIDGTPADATNLIAGDEFGSIDSISKALPFQVVVPSGLGDPTAIFANTAGADDSRAIEFDYQTTSDGPIVVQEHLAQVPIEEWPKAVDGIVATNGLPMTHGTAQAVTIRGGRLALLTISEDKSNSTIEWYEAPNFEMSVFGPGLSANAAIAIAENL